MPVQTLTLFRWLMRHYLMWLVMFFLVLAGIIWLFEVAELLRRAANRPEVTFGLVLEMSTLKLPETLERVLPFVVLFGAFFSIFSLTRSQELVVARATGISAWQFLMPTMVVTVIVGVVSVGIFNPLGATLITRYRALEAQHLKLSTSLELTGAGLWLRHNDGQTHYLLHGDHVTTHPLTVSPVMVLLYDQNSHYIGRIDSPEAVLQNGFWLMNTGWRNQEDQPREKVDSMRLVTHLTDDTIEGSMAPPDSIGFWQLPDFMKTLTAIGLPTHRHALKWHGLLATPLLLLGMALCAAVFALRPMGRRKGALWFGIGSFLSGVGLFTLNNLLATLGMNQVVPLIIASWTTPLVAVVIGTLMLLYTEDG